MKKALLLLAAMAAVNLSTAQVELLSNGSFEDGTAAPWTIDAVNGVVLQTYCPRTELLRHLPLSTLILTIPNGY